MGACSGIEKPDLTIQAPIFERAVTKEENGVRVSASVLGNEEARRVFGIDLARKDIQALWIKVENDVDRPIVLLPTAIDPEYFSPFEVSFAYHEFLADDANEALDTHLLKLNFPIRSLIQPGTAASGYIFTNWTNRNKVVDVDLIGDDFSRNFTFFIPNPDSEIARNIVERLETELSDSERQNIQREADLRRALEQLPCCVSKEIGGPPAEPLNVVMIGALDDWTTAFMRRGYRYEVLNPRYAFGHAQDISGRKLNPKYTEAQAHTFRVWRTPIRYRGKPVWVGQTGLRLGGRFRENAPEEVTLPLDPYIDETRYNFVQDLAYSQALTKIGHVKGGGRSQSTRTEGEAGNVHYKTDGLRAVLVFGDRPSSLASIDFFDWERLADYR